MRNFWVVLILAFASALILPTGQAEAGKRIANSVSLAGVTPVLAAKAREIVANCGSVIISTIAPRPIQSNHPIGRAVDLRGNPGCIYAHLKGWPGGYSTDYAAAKHVHISYNPGGQEWGLRFVHGNGTGTRHASQRLYRDGMQTVLSAAARHSGHAH
jgi:hypothetical protein